MVQEQALRDEMEDFVKIEENVYSYLLLPISDTKPKNYICSNIPIGITLLRYTNSKL